MKGPEPGSAPGVVVVTGAASGIGRAVCTLLVAKGAQVIATDQDQSGLSSLHGELGETLLPQTFDVTQVADWERHVGQWEARVGPIQALVYAAGRLIPGELCDPELNQDAFRSTFEVHVTGLWAAARAVAHNMKRRRRGAIVAVTSNAGSTPRLHMGSYPASKAGAIMLLQCLALELGPAGIRVNSVAPGSTDTPLLTDLLRGQDPSTLISGDLSTFRTGIPLGRIASPQDIAQAVGFLLSEQARHVTGINLRVDGGATWS